MTQILTHLSLVHKSTRCCICYDMQYGHYLVNDEIFIIVQSTRLPIPVDTLRESKLCISLSALLARLVDELYG